VDFPAPFGPTSATRSPRFMKKSRPLKTRVSPYDFRTFVARTTTSPERGAGGKPKRTFFVRLGASIRSIFSSALTRDWTCLAFVFL
jgi:hypothetical protein